MNRFLLIAILALFIIGCGATQERREFKRTTVAISYKKVESPFIKVHIYHHHCPIGTYPDEGGSFLFRETVSPSAFNELSGVLKVLHLEHRHAEFILRYNSKPSDEIDNKIKSTLEKAGIVYYGIILNYNSMLESLDKYDKNQQVIFDLIIDKSTAEKTKLEFSKIGKYLLKNIYMFKRPFWPRYKGDKCIITIAKLPKHLKGLVESTITNDNGEKIKIRDVFRVRNLLIMCHRHKIKWFYLAGAFKKHTKEDLKKLIEEAGYKVVDSISVFPDFVVLGYKDIDTVKQEAIDMGIVLLTEGQLLKYLKD